MIFSTFNYVEEMAISKFWLDVSEEMVGVGEGLVTLQSLSTIEKNASPLNFYSNELFSKLPSQLPTSGNLRFPIRYVLGKYEVWEGIRPLITLNLTQGTRTSDFKPNEPILKFLRSPFLYKLDLPQGYNLQPLAWGL